MNAALLVTYNDFVVKTLMVGFILMRVCSLNAWHICGTEVAKKQQLLYHYYLCSVSV